MHNTGETSMTVSTGYEDCHHFDKINEFYASQLMCLGRIAVLASTYSFAFTSYPRSTPSESPRLSFETACYHHASIADRSY